MRSLNNIKVELLLLLFVFIGINVFSELDKLVHSYVLNINKVSGGLYLKEFFVNITELGSSAWYFSIFVCCLIILYLLKKIDIVSIKNINGKISFFITCTVYLAVVGILTQVLKHIIGRPRPNHADFNDLNSFNYLSFDSSFHSFPSGHSSTIFMVCFILCSILPKLKYYFVFLAIIIAISRVVVGAHFFTDVVAGGLLSLLVYRFLNNYLVTNYKHYLFNEILLVSYGDYKYYIIVLSGICLFLSVGPSLDLYASSLFYLGNSQFSLQSIDLTSILFRKILIPAILIYILILPIVGRFYNISKLFFGVRFAVKEILLIWFSQIVSMLVVINLLLKNLWGRARPGDILQFGGSEIFTPWYKISNSCYTNCSFVSGDASVGFAFIVLYFLTKKIIFLYASLIFGFVLGFIRIIAGGHFLSDVVFSGLIIILLNLLIVKLYNKINE